MVRIIGLVRRAGMVGSLVIIEKAEMVKMVAVDLKILTKLCPASPRAKN